MEKLFILLSICSPFSLFAQQDTTLNGVKFEQGISWKQVKTKAKSENKYIFVDCYATWCGPCKLMDRDIYPNFRAGYALNEKFISVKVQLDSTSNDNDAIKSWYEDARSIALEYKIESLPTFLFFSSDGRLIHKDAGARDLSSFIRLTELARSPQKAHFYDQYTDYKRGIKDYSSLGGLSVFTKKLIGDVPTARMMAYDYINNYLLKLDTALLYTQEIFLFIDEFPELLTSKDPFFSLAYNNPKKYDSTDAWQGISSLYVGNVICREEISDKILNDGKAITKLPDWNKYETVIRNKYYGVDARKMVLAYKIDYYKFIYKDWGLWAKYKDKMISLYPPKKPFGTSVYEEINGTGGAWHVFLNCNDRAILKKAIEWADLAIAMDPENKDAYLDTKANLLYKLGRKEEAIRYEEEAVSYAILCKEKRGPNAVPSFQKIVDQMKNNKPTYLDEGAIWTEYSPSK